MGFALVVAVIGAVLVIWPVPFAWFNRLYGSASVLSLNAGVRRSPSRQSLEVFGRTLGALLLLGSVVLMLALS